MKRRAFQEWMGRVGWAAALLLLVMPTAGRLLQASSEGGQGSHHERIATAHAASPSRHAPTHATHSASSIRDGARQPPAPLPDTGPDCDYCPLLGSLVTLAHAAFALPDAPEAAPASSVPGPPRIARLHPNGLGSRGPPIHR